MQLFQRISDIIAANLNELVDRFEDPEVMLKQAIREMDAMIEQATSAAARAIAGERLLAKDLADHEGKTRRWRTRAEQAVGQGDDALARQAIARAHEHETLACALLEQRSTAAQTAQALRRQIDAMKAKQAEARRKLASLSARRQAAQASRALRGRGGEFPHRPRGFARFEQMRRQVEQAEAEAEALGELFEDPASCLDDEAEAREQSRAVEVELAAIKERLGKAKA
jgi:phage shock protein A